MSSDWVLSWDGDPTRRGRVGDADTPADDSASPVDCAGEVRGSADSLAGGANLLAAWVDVPFGFVVDLDDLAGVVFSESADSFAGGRELPFTVNELS